MPGTQYFRDKQLQAGTNEGTFYKPDQKYALECEATVDRVRNDLEEGILTKFRTLRTKQIEGIVVDNCWNNKKFSYTEAVMCEKFHMENDYKLGQINSFVNDHMVKHYFNYMSCYKGLEGAGTAVQKEKAFKDCHDEWVSDFKENQS